MVTERIPRQTFGAFLEAGIHMDDTGQVIEEYIDGVLKLKDVGVKEIYAQRGGFPDTGFIVRFLTIISGGPEGGTDKVEGLHHLVERQLHSEFPLTKLSFRTLPSSLSPENIQKFMDGYIPKGELVYPRLQKNDPATITP